MPFSILLLTLNEEQNLPACLKAIDWCDDVVVLDSFSIDRTVEIAKERGVRVFQRKFDTFAAQRNHALEQIEFSHPWVFHLDADEIFTDALRHEVETAIENPVYDAWRVPSKMMFLGKWLRHSGMYPSYQVRLTKSPDFRFRQVGHGQKADIPLEKIGTLTQPYLHYSFSKGLSEWFEKHNRYSSDEAEAALTYKQGGGMDWAGLFASDPSRRRLAMRMLVFRLPFRPLLRFVYMYIFRLGFLDGSAGYTYCRLMATYEWMIVCKIKEKMMSRQDRLS
jgi:glycosyltransferase involved in cell wall biosynthesis